jgi:hypothetical protein
LLARFAARRGDVAGAREHGSRAVALAEEARAKQATDLHAVRILCDALADLADLEAEQQHGDLARSYGVRTLALAAQGPYAQDSRIQAATARVLLILGRPSQAAAITASLGRRGYRRPSLTDGRGTTAPP